MAGLVSALAHVVASSLARELSQPVASYPRTVAALFVAKRRTYMSFFQPRSGQSGKKTRHYWTVPRRTAKLPMPSWAARLLLPSCNRETWRDQWSGWNSLADGTSPKTDNYWRQLRWFPSQNWVKASFSRNNNYERRPEEWMWFHWVTPHSLMRNNS